MRKRRVRHGQVWHTAKGYRRVLWTSRYFVGYSNKYGRKTRTCLLKTFRRWIVTSGARCAQRKRRRDLSLAA